MNFVVLSGRLGQDLEVKQTQNGKSYARFSIAVNTGFGDNKRTSWLPCTVWGKSAESMAKWCKKGTLVNIRGEAVQNNYTNKDGNKVNSIEFTVREWEFGGSKSDNQQTEQSEPEAPKQESNDGFMNIPDGINEELPFN